MKTVIIGSGNVAFHLAKAFTQNNFEIAQVFGRNMVELSEISQNTGIPYSVNNLEDADFYLIAVKDDSIAEVSAIIKKTDCLVAHTSASVSRETLSGNYRKSVFYPLQTFSKKKNLDYSEIPVFLDTETQKDFDILYKAAQSFTSKIATADDEKRKFIHLSAVFCCNFVNHLFALGKEIADSKDIPFNYFLPLINETVEKINFFDPKTVQTGPAVRNDEKTLQMQMELLKDDEQKAVYKAVTNSIKKMYELQK